MKLKFKDSEQSGNYGDNPERYVLTIAKNGRIMSSTKDLSRASVLKGEDIEKIKEYNKKSETKDIIEVV